MSMLAYLRQITPERLAAFRRKPAGVARFLRERERAGSALPAAMHENVEHIQELMLRGMAASNEVQDVEAHIKQYIGEEEPPAGFSMVREGGDLLDLGKHWQVLHYLLTGTPWDRTPPLGNAILGGTEIGSDVGYGPARFLTAAQVREVSAALAGIAWETVLPHFDLEAMEAANVYGVGTDDEDEIAEVRECLDALIAFYSGAAARGNAVLLYVE